MKERAIRCYEHEVRAILAGTQTQLRRPMKPQPALYEVPTGRGIEHRLLWPGRHPPLTQTSDQSAWIDGCCYGVAGDHLRVQETWCSADTMYQGHENDVPSCIGYPADKTAILYNSDRPRSVPSWDLAQWNWDKLTMRSSATMPRWASRITLEVVSVRVQRLQEITDEDARAEGVEPAPHPLAPRSQSLTYRDSFATLWDRSYGKRAPWATNPWIWTLTFRRLP